MKIVVFGGTTEGRLLSQRLASEGAQVIVSVASEYGREEQGEMTGVSVSEGLKDEDGIRRLIRGADAVVDATHPYAVLVTENIRQAAEKEGVRRFRLIRDNDGLSGSTGLNEERGILFARDAEEAAGIAGRAEGPVLLTTGSKDLAIYAEAIDPARLIARVLPVVSSIEACGKAGIPHRNIIAAQGPFSEELNRTVIRDYGIRVLVTKESGRAGGFSEKIRACQKEGIPAVVISRPSEDGLSFEEVLDACRAITGQG